MQRIRLRLKKDLDRSYEIVVARGALGSLAREIEKLGTFSGLALVTDEFVGAVVAEPLQARLESQGLRPELLILPAGETAKTVATVVDLCQELVARGFDRKALLLAVGGGVVGDITGFAAAIYLRGISYIQVPTTLLAQVDSAIGGKTGVDLGSGKNILGSFHQPLLVVSDPNVLETLPAAARRDGFAEVIKTALVGDPELFALLEKEGSALEDPRHSLLETVIARAAGVKCRVVSQDEQEAGLRRILNFGHTLGHAVEAASGYAVSHGRAVAAGMAVALRLSSRWGGLPWGETARALALTEAFGLPVEIPGSLDTDAIMGALDKDKKIQAGVCHFVLLAEIGRPVLRAVPLEELREELVEMLG